MESPLAEPSRPVGGLRELLQKILGLCLGELGVERFLLSRVVQIETFEGSVARSDFLERKRKEGGKLSGSIQPPKP